MIRGLLDIIAGRSERRAKIQRITHTEPLKRFDAVEDLGYFPHFKPLARALAKHTHLMVESLLCDETISDWVNAATEATSQQLMNVGTFCSHCLVQFAIKETQGKSVQPLPADLIADLSDLARVMYGDFAPKRPPGAITFDESLQLLDLEDDLEIGDLTRWLDQLLGIEDVENATRVLKIQKIRSLFVARVRAFAYRLHGVS